MDLTEAQRANLKRARFSPILLRIKTHRRAPAGPGVRVLKGLATRGLVELRSDMAGLAYHITTAGLAALTVS